MTAGVGNGSPLQYSCLENTMDRGAWRAKVHGVTESDMTEQLSMHTQWLQVFLNYVLESNFKFLQMLFPQLNI